MAPPPDEPNNEILEGNDNIDLATFEQILDMDEEPGDREFSQGIVFDFFTQAENTFALMDTDIETKNLQALSDKGHFLKGSSATLGFTKIKDECEKIQNYGRKKNETGTADEPDEKKCLELIQESLSVAKTACRDVEALMRRYYNED